MMNKLVSAASVLVLTAGVASAAPRESVTFTNVNSVGFQGNAGNTTLTNTFNGSDGSGSYSATYLTVTGTLGNRAGATFGREACILVTPPTGTPFVVEPFNIDGWTTTTVDAPAGRYAIPPSAFTTAGQWSFEFIELFDDVTTGAGVDCVWQTITFTLQDGTPPVGPTGPNLSTSQSMTWTNVDSDGLVGAPGSTRSVVFNSSAPVSTLVLRGSATGTRGFSASSTNCLLERMIVQVVPPSGAPINAALFPHTAFSTDNSALSISLPAAIDPVGTWTLNFFQTIDQAGGVDGIWNDITLAVGNVAAPVATAITIPGDGSFGSSPVNFTAAGQTQWFTFTLAAPMNGFIGDFLDIDTETSAITDTAIGLYGPTGSLVVADFDDGTDLLSQISFGAGTRAAPGNGVAYNGRDGGYLAAGTYYVAVTAGNTGVAFQPGAWGVNNTNTNTGSATLNIRKGTNTLPDAPAATDLGVVTGPNGLSTTIDTTGTQIQWFKFTLNNDVSNVGGTWLDIDTEGTTGITDTELGLYARSGVLVATDDDDGSGNLTQLTFGQTTPARVYTGTAGGNGRDGAFIPAGTYYLAAGIFNVTYAANFVVTSTGTATGNIHINFHTNLPAGPVRCNAADVAGLGGSVGPDGALTADDVVVYLAAFFSNDLAVADIAVLGGAPGQDGQLTADDIVYFLGQFFSPCN